MSRPAPTTPTLVGLHEGTALVHVKRPDDELEGTWSSKLRREDRGR
jgi:hypothetical protein